MKIRITTKREGFRRAGMAHYGTREYPADAFSDEQIKALQGDPMLVVAFVEEDGGELVSPAREEKEKPPPEAKAPAHDAAEWGSPDSPPVTGQPEKPQALEQAEASQVQEQAPADKAAKPTSKKSK